MNTSEVVNASVAIRDAAPADFDAILALNEADVVSTSAMDRARLEELNGLSCYHRVACRDGHVVAFLLAMQDGAAYENDNFRWFSSRYKRFVYVDRVVVSGDARGLRLGTLLYDDLFSWARRLGIPVVVCEYNIVPPNEPSRLFHAKFGFKEQGRQWVANGTKQVSLQAAPL
jgi:predicted GNAT superfamily acetyltransferase